MQDSGAGCRALDPVAVHIYVILYVCEVFMRQVTIYLDVEAEKRLNEAVRKKKISRSKWICDLIKERTSRTWPESIVELAGAWPDFPELDRLRSKEKDSKRARL